LDQKKKTEEEEEKQKIINQDAVQKWARHEKKKGQSEEKETA